MNEFTIKELAYTIIMCTQAYIECQGMIAENQHKLAIGKTDLYGEEAFQKVIEKHGIHHNAVLSRFQYT